MRRARAATATAAGAGAALLLLAVAALSTVTPRRGELLAAASSGSKVLAIAGDTFENPTQVYAEQLRAASDRADNGYSGVLRRIKEQQAQAEAQMKHLVQENKAKARALSRALDGDSFHVASAAAPIAVARPSRKSKVHPRRGRSLPARPAASAKASAGQADVKASRGGGGNRQRTADVTRVQARISKLVVDAHERLKKDQQRAIADLTSSAAQGPWFQHQQAVRLQDDRRRVLGDQRLIKLLRAMRAQQGLLPSASAPMQHLDAIDLQARNDLFAAEMRARQRGLADEVNPHTHNLLAAGVKAGHSRDVGLGGMEGDDADPGSDALTRAGVRTDGLPGFGTKYAEAIPLPFFDAPDDQQHNITALGEHHRPISPAGERMLHKLKVNLAAPNVFVYGDEAHSTPASDRHRDEYGEYGFIDGLEDAETKSDIARQHKPLSFWISNPKQGSKRLAGPGKVNVYGESTWDGIMSHMPAFVNDWSHPVKPDPARPPDHWLSDNVRGGGHVPGN